MSSQAPRVQAENRQLMMKLLVIAAAMLAFAYALVPIYRKICEVLGIDQTRVVIAQSSTQVDYSRKVTMQFVSNRVGGLEWEFEPLTKETTFHPGEMVEVRYRVKNTLGRDITAQAKPHIAPESAARYVTKTACFCFNNQHLKAGEEQIMAVQLRVDPALAKDTPVMTMSYTFFDVATIHGRS